MGKMIDTIARHSGGKKSMEQYEVFPKARSGDLAESLRNECPPEFRSAQTFAVALSQLASAVQQVRELFVDDLKMVGCLLDIRS
jgi:hypothetical protein